MHLSLALKIFLIRLSMGLLEIRGILIIHLVVLVVARQQQLRAGCFQLLGQVMVVVRFGFQHRLAV